ncbi:ecdysone-induced protein 74EF isoform X2 [Nasonia vitripennis]|uniref:C2H2-type domain-containing protein n=1 Tax=Nasonia vitripennis TaxID=7425 RepID=A0A7M7ITG0_NASVI|nr:ecdysone-induced protein 74EF isoform X2 [Nasonia vitripennis]
MEASGAGIGRLDCYEDMFKEITRKLYGEDPDHRTSSVQNEFETSVSYKNEEDTGNGTDGSDDGNWTLDDEPLKGTEGSRIAAYRAATATWRCYECGDCMGGGPRDVAEHFVEMHSSRFLAEEASRGRLNSSGRSKDYLDPSNLKIEDVVSYLERVRDRAERGHPPTRRTQETQTVPAALLPMAASTFLLQELSSTPPQHLHQSSIASMTGSGTSATAANGASNGSNSSSNASSTASISNGSSTTAGGGGGGGGGNGGGVSGNNASGKRYTCLYCPYGTDRRDLYTRHENIHREEKPFHCYVCYKPFSRADHVKKHFLRMHREHTYELSRIRRPAGSSSAIKVERLPNNESSGNANNTSTSTANSSYLNTSVGSFTSPKQPQQQQQQQQLVPQPQQLTITSTTTYQLPTPPPTATAALYQAASLSSAVVAAANSIIQQQQQQQQQQPEATAPVNSAAAQAARRLQSSAFHGKSQVKSTGSSSSKGNQERRYTCCYCSWSGVDNWCLKRHLNTHLKPYACALCEYKAARAERLATHVLKVHNRRQCSRCSFLAEDMTQLQVHQLHVHRVSNASVAAAAAAATVQSSVGQQQNNNQASERQQAQQPQPIHPVGGGRPPPGPPVFPASSAAIAPATTVIPPTTILGSSEVATMPDNSACWEQESAWCEERFNRRSRKQRTPRKVMTIPDCEVEETALPPAKDEPKKPEKSIRRRLRCFLCPKSDLARAYGTQPYHTRQSLILHKLWRHGRQSKSTGLKARATKRAAITLEAVVYAKRAFVYQR